MSFTISTREATAGDKTGAVYALGDETARIEVWPFLGFNCLRWQVRNKDGSWGDLLYAAPDWERNPVPTRSGHPVLFPFPNRIAGGRFNFEGTAYQLPLNEATGQHAIHGFTPRNPWRVIDTSAESAAASITGEFRLSRDLPASASLWPADFILRLTYRLSANALEVHALVENPDSRPLPFGLGYHPYFCLPTAPNAPADDLLLYSAARVLWEADEAIPTGRRLPIPSELDFRSPRPVGGAALDRLFTDLFDSEAETSVPVAWIGHPAASGRLVVECPEAFRELLIFTPPHRKAVAIEPYTCTTDAPNLTERGIEAGWRVIAPGARFSEAVRYRWELGT
jgi:aldose 1-epimerase